MTPITGAHVRAANETSARLSLSDARMEELTIELEQLRAAIERVARKVDFDSEPSNFQVALLALAGEYGA